MKEGYWFRSTHLQIDAGEDLDVNPGIYGRQLAYWLKSQLELRGYPVVDVIPEDFGWCVRCQLKPFLLWIACGNVVDVQPRHALACGDDIVWHCFPVAETPLLTRLFKSLDTEPALTRLDELLRQILLAEPTIQLVDAP